MRRSIPLVLALLVAAAPAPAQQRAALDSRVRLGQRLRIQPQAQPLREGVLSRLDADSLSLRDGDTLHTIARSAVDSLWARGSHFRAGALVGAVVGTLPVILACADTLDECGLLPNGVILVAGSAGIGALIGSALHRWKRIYP